MEPPRCNLLVWFGSPCLGGYENEFVIILANYCYVYPHNGDWVCQAHEIDRLVRVVQSRPVWFW
jgi:hypothetical protein